MSDRPVDRSHYSYTTYADPGMAASFDATRFSGPIGQLVAEAQERVLEDFAAPIAGRTFLDVGTGTGRAALILARAGGKVTGVDASAEMLAAAEQGALACGAAVRFAAGDAHALEFQDRAFDACVCFRVLMHAPGWQTCVGELCRVARQQVILDYPAAVSAAVIQAAWRRVAHRLGRPVESYRVFTRATIAGELRRHGFRIAREHRQFVLPIALHRAIGSRGFTGRTERALERIGLLRVLGSPVTVLAERCES